MLILKSSDLCQTDALLSSIYVHQTVFRTKWLNPCSRWLVKTSRLSPFAPQPLLVSELKLSSCLFSSLGPSASRLQCCWTLHRADVMPGLENCKLLISVRLFRSFCLSISFLSFPLSFSLSFSLSLRLSVSISYYIDQKNMKTSIVGQHERSHNWATLVYPPGGQRTNISRFLHSSLQTCLLMLLHICRYIRIKGNIHLYLHIQSSFVIINYDWTVAGAPVTESTHKWFFFYIFSFPFILPTGRLYMRN